MASSQAILLTPPGPGAIAVVRLSGPGIGAFLHRYFSRPAAVGRCIHGELSDGRQIIDDPVVVLGDQGNFADVNLHGGPWVVQSALNLARREGFDVIQGPAALEAANSMDGRTALEKEMLAHVPMATTELALRTLLSQPDAWKSFCLHPPTRAEIEAVLADQSLWRLLHPPRVAIIGPANVGKSTLANALFAQERSITADVPGTTRDWVGQLANIDGLTVTLLDTPGIRATDDAIEAAAITGSRAEIERAELVILVMDASRPPDEQEQTLRRDFGDGLLVINKCDLPPAWNWGSSLRVSAKTGMGMDDLRIAIRKRFGCAGEMSGAKWWTERQRQILESARTDPRSLDKLAEVPA